MENSQSNLPKIQILKTLQTNLSALGIDAISANHSRPINAKILMDFLVLSIGILAILVYIFHEAKTFFEYVQAVSVCSTYILLACILMILILKRSELFEMIITCQCLLDTSKLKSKLKPFARNTLRNLLYITCASLFIPFI